MEPNKIRGYTDARDARDAPFDEPGFLQTYIQNRPGVADILSTRGGGGGTTTNPPALGAGGASQQTGSDLMPGEELEEWLAIIDDIDDPQEALAEIAGDLASNVHQNQVIAARFGQEIADEIIPIA